MAKEKRTLGGFSPLWPAEQLILDGLDDPHLTQVGDGTLPPADAPRDRQVRASFLRWCALGAGEGHRIHETGLRIAGALVVSDVDDDPLLRPGSKTGLNLEGCHIEGDIGFVQCRFEDPPLLRSTQLRNLFLNHSAFPGINAVGLTTEGDVLFRGAVSEGEVHLLGARIGGGLDCVGGKFGSPNGVAFIADRLTTEGSIFLRDVVSEGAVRLLGARIGGDLVCVGGTFANPNGDALNASGAVVKGFFYWRGGVRAEGTLDLTNATFGDINDDPSCWPDRLILVRCQYGAFTSRGTSAEERIDWLSRQNPADYGHDFWPQPWEQCAKVLREMGHAEDARAVLIDKERRLRQARRERGAR